MFKLVISDDEGKTTTVPLVRDEITIGRKEGNTIRLTDRNVSRRHARLQKQNGHYLLHDLGSYNGVVMNGARLLDAQAVKSGDQIMIGDYKLAILEEATVQVQAPPAHEDTLDTAATSVVAAPPPSAAMAPPPTAPSMPQVQQGSAAEAIPSEVRQMRLVFLAPAGAPAPVTLDRLPLILGRSEAADIALPYSSISREHARLSVQGGLLIIEDLGSSNGVLVNGERTNHAVVGPGDMVTLGVVEFRIAQRGDQTVIFDRSKPATSGADPDLLRPAPASAGGGKSSLPLILAAVGALAVVAGVAFVLKGSGSHPPPQSASPPEVAGGAQAASGVPPTTAIPTAPAPAAAPTVAAPVAPSVPAPPVVAAVPTAPPAPVPVIAAPPPSVPDPPEPRVAAVRAPAPAAPEPHEHHHVAAAAAPAPAPPPVVHAAAPPPASHPVASNVDAMAEARACRGDNQCVIAALGAHAQTEQELGLLAVTYRLSGNHAQAVRTMQRYLQRFPSGPRAAGFHDLLDNQ